MKKNKGHFAVGFDSRRLVSTNTGLWDFRLKLGEMLRDKSLDAFNYLVETLNDKSLNPKVRQASAIEILNRSWGLPVSTINVEHSENNRGGQDVTKMSNEDLEALVATLALEEKQKGKSVIEGEIVINDAGTYSGNDAKKSLKQSGVSE